MISVVFLLLVFFLVVGSMARGPDPEVRLLALEAADARMPPDALALYQDGRLAIGGRELALAEALRLAPDADLRIVADRGVAATRLVEVASALRAAGAARVSVLGESGLR